jgi:hypothetical protein
MREQLDALKPQYEGMARDLMQKIAALDAERAGLVSALDEVQQHLALYRKPRGQKSATPRTKSTAGRSDKPPLDQAAVVSAVQDALQDRGRLSREELLAEVKSRLRASGRDCKGVAIHLDRVRDAYLRELPDGRLTLRQPTTALRPCETNVTPEPKESSHVDARIA